VGVILFVVNFFVANLRSHEKFIASNVEKAFVVCFVLAGLGTAGFALLNLRLEHRSHARHLRYRYERRTLESLPSSESAGSDRLSAKAADFLTAAFVLLFVEIGFAVAFFVVWFI
jgi:hypothetical protein